MNFFSSDCRDSHNRAFTLIEVLLVITIIGILSVLAVNSYIYARYRGLLNVETDRIVQTIRDARFAVLRGNSSVGPECRGIEFDNGVKLLQAPYLPDGSCDEFTLSDQLVFTHPIQVVSKNKTVLYFTPPEAEYSVRVNDVVTDKKPFDIMVQFGEKDDPNWQKIIHVDPLTYSVSVQ